MEEKIKTELPIGPPVIEHFILEGVNGNKNIEVNFEKNVKVISAENGSGKTTTLNALYALLAQKPARLNSLNFKSLRLKLAGKTEITYIKENASNRATGASSMEPMRRHDTPFFKYEVTPDDCQDMLCLLLNNDIDGFRNSTGYKHLMEVSPYDHEELVEQCKQLIDEGFVVSEAHLKVYEQINTEMKRFQILYLPTYRRIEANIAEAKTRKRYRHYEHLHPSMRNQNDWDGDNLIFYGMRDVEKKIETIAREIKEGTFRAYNRESRVTLSQLLAGSNQNSPNEIDSNSSDFKLVLARLGKTDEETIRRVATLIESGEINEEEHRHLRDLLNRLSGVYNEKKEQETALENFVDIVNSYWDMQSERKHFEFDKAQLDIKIIDDRTKKQIPMDVLSSGEKQIVSMFARLYLDTAKPNIMLIDEPELSLSIAWQRKLLPDIVETQSCKQLIAITHSPFIFENALDGYAGSMKISYQDQ